MYPPAPTRARLAPRALANALLLRPRGAASTAMLAEGFAASTASIDPSSIHVIRASPVAASISRRQPTTEPALWQPTIC